MVSNIHYRGDNQMLQCAYGNGLQDNRAYDLQGRLLSQQLEDTLANIIDQRSHNYDPNSNIRSININADETTTTGSLIKDHIWQSMMPVAQIDNTVNTDDSNTESIIYLYTDHLMTNRLATDENQIIVWRWEGEAFGNKPAQELAGIPVNLRFPGQYYDQETNLHYNWNRYYDPSIGR